MESNTDAEGKPEEKNDKPLPIKSVADLQRLKLDKLMKNFNKPVFIPERPKERNVFQTPEFVRNVMGSSAGAGSGEFHVYRHLRRKEYARQKYIQQKSEKELLDEAYHKKLEENARIAEERTSKRRAKRLKKKEKMKNKAKKPKQEPQEVKEEVSDENEEEAEEEKDKEENKDEKQEECDSGKNDKELQ